MTISGLVRLSVFGFACLAIGLAAGPAWATVPFKDCPLTGVMPDYAAGAAPHWKNWDSYSFHITVNGEDKDVEPHGAVCVQDYDENQGKTEGSLLEISENYKAAMQQQGAEIVQDRPGYVVGHLAKDGKEYWLNVNATRDDGYEIREVQVEPFKRTLLPPSGSDYQLLGHMPGFTADPPTKKNFDEHGFPTEDGEVAIRGAFYSVNYQPPANPSAREITAQEIMENYREALADLHAEILLDHGDDANISARLENQGKTVYLFVESGRVIAVEEKPFQMTLKPPTVDELKDKLDKDGHIALYVNFDFAKATLKSDAAPVVAQVVELLKRNPDLSVSIEGHTDGVGGHDYNVKLSQDRAASVVAAITAGGIDGARIKSAGYGPDKPIAPNDTDAGRAKNRRVELVKAS